MPTACIHAHTRTQAHPPTHTDSWGVTLLAWQPEWNTEEDGQAGAGSVDAGTRSLLLTLSNGAHVKCRLNSN